ncbi:uncharacterized protein [Solanum tuberosum]|uniref:uncharacterized protein isoform X1 n=1 Tax=Solanum tuberosum TaxID=4113 RepID=UPI00073A515A|nr:PREDICTED: uncharacterized protein LOC107063022 isoform X1 [Solanum tuberosum]
MPFPSMNPSSLERSQLNFFLTSTNFGSVERSWYTNIHHFVQKINYSKGLILVIFCRKVLSILFVSLIYSSLVKFGLSYMPLTKFLQTNNILIYENPREIVIPPSNDIEIVIAPIRIVESIIIKLMLYCPRIMSILPCINSKVLQVLSALKRCTQRQKCGCNGVTIEKGRASIWYSWLKSTILIDQVTSFMLTWEVIRR